MESTAVPVAEVESARPRPQARALWLRLDPGLRLAVTVVLTFRIGLELVGFLTMRLEPQKPENAPHWLLRMIIHDGQPWSQFVSIWQRWDSLWFQQIAMHGYRAGNDTVAFQPLFSVLSRILSFLFLGHIVPAELTVTTAAYLVALWLFYKLARLDVGPVTARLAVLLIAFFPTAYYFTVPYTESLFLATSLAAFWLARHKKPWLAGLAGLAASLTRTVGIFLVLPLAIEYLLQRHEEGRRPGIGLLAAGLPLVGYQALGIYWQRVVGEHRSTFQVQLDWGTHMSPTWTALRDAFHFIALTKDPVETLNVVCLFGFSALAIVVAYRLPIPYAWYVLPYLVFMFNRETTTVSPLAALCRYMVVLFPCFLVLAQLLVRRRLLATGWLVVTGMAQVLLFVHWVHFGWVA